MKKKNRQHWVKFYRDVCLGSPDTGYGPGKDIVRAFEDVNEDYLIVPDTVGINRSTARINVSRYVREGRIAERPKITLGT